MHQAPNPLDHDHVFGQDRVRPGERKTRAVIAITLVMMVVEIAAGIAYGSMALLADGLHMASHATALTITAFAYLYARRHAADHRFTFGTGKVNALGGFAGAVLLAAFAAFMAFESVARLLHPVPIGFNQAIAVAVIGLAVNGFCALILGDNHDHHDHEEHDHDHDHHHAHAHADSHHHDHNLRSAYLHVIADALTSVTAIGALLAGKYFAWNWMDPAMGIVGSALVAWWSVGLVRVTAAVLLDRQAPDPIVDDVRASLEALPGNVTVTDLHVWSVGPAIFAAEIALRADHPAPIDHYKRSLPDHLGLVHVTVEVHPNSPAAAANPILPRDQHPLAPLPDQPPAHALG